MDMPPPTITPPPKPPLVKWAHLYMLNWHRPPNFDKGMTFSGTFRDGAQAYIP